MNFFHWGEFDPHLTVNSWFVSPKILKIFRLVVAIYSWIILIGELLDYALREHFLAQYGFENDAECFLCYFTILSYIGQTVYFTAAAFYSIRSNSLEKFSKLHNFLFWILYHTVVHYHVLIVFVYWTLLSSTFIQENNPWYIWWLSVSVHGLEFVTMLIELFLNRQVMKISFIFITIFIQVLYMLETFLIYYTHGFWIYDFLDWHSGSPAAVSLRYIGFLIFFIVCFFLVYGLHTLRDYIGRKHNSKESSENVSDLPMSTIQ
ncbi:21220_t:CDS:2 [Dentiscutata erythropus]|uniref:21220_t:CDS:1 n=1 Tax=Dentiscutata erythropus TaxID=1348616 RepID=A0A9N8W100_9GLOM|nr:21220_t:CDS:2 [Dentiscutata erythropus]